MAQQRKVAVPIKSVKVDKYFIVRNEAGYFCFSGGTSVYVLVPARIRDILKTQFGINLQRKPKNIKILCEMRLEGGQAKLVYEFSLEPSKDDVKRLIAKEEVKAIV